ncbi:hypothetical protein PI124_g4320 [Phytophthora idaei]|nr:hypothetical protein PI125_g4137 [Phytophthora idaei]KAG3251055.1 hypothetical protein PI124_g4320 [Phytophthora idaei]
MSAVRRLVDQVASKLYPFLKARLVVTARIVNYPDLELGLVKLQRGEHLKMRCVLNLERQVSRGCQEAALRRRRCQGCIQEAQGGKALDVGYIPPTSNECEHLFFYGGQACADGSAQEYVAKEAWNGDVPAVQ